MFDWENLRHFLAVARVGTLSGAARSLHVDHATVSRRLAALEAELQIPLVERLPRSCRLTATGMQILEQARAMESAAFSIARQSQVQQTSLRGKVTLSASPMLSTHFLAPRMADFHSLYPGIQLSIRSEAHQVSLSRAEADLALRHVRPREPSNIARRIGRIPFALYASRDYPALAEPERWVFITYDDRFVDMPQRRWLLEIAGGRLVACELSDVSSQLIAACAGAGIAGLPCFLGDAQASLAKLEHGGAAFSHEIWLVTHRDLRRSATVRAVMDYLAKSFADSEALGLA